MSGRRRFNGAWEERKLGELARIATGSRNNQDKRPDGKYPFFVRSSSVERISSFAYDCEAILVPGEGRIGEIFHYVDGRFDVHQRVYVLSNVVSAVSVRFLYFYMAAFFGPHAMQNTVKATVDSLRLPTFQAFRLSLPPLPEQRAIATVLKNVDALIGSLETLIAKKRAIKQAAMQQLLTGRTRLPGFEEEWRAGRLKDVAQLHRDHVMPPDGNRASYELFSLPAYDSGRRPSVEPSAAIQSGKFRVPRDAVLLSRLNPRIPRVWAPTSIGPNAIASTEFLVLTPREAAVRTFLFWLCSSPQFCDRMVAAVTGTTGSHQRVNRIDAMNLHIRFPSLPEQRSIAAVLSDMDAEIAALERRLDKTRALKQGMIQQLLTGSIRLPIPDAVSENGPSQ